MLAIFPLRFGQTRHFVKIRRFGTKLPLRHSLKNLATIPKLGLKQERRSVLLLFLKRPCDDWLSRFGPKFAVKIRKTDLLEPVG